MSLQRTIRWATFFLITLVAAWAVYLLVAGLSTTRFAEAQPGRPLPPGQMVMQPYPPVLFALLALLPAAVGLLQEKWHWLAWGSVVLLLLGGLLLIFTIGITLIIAAAALALLLAMLHKVG